MTDPELKARITSQKKASRGAVTAVSLFDYTGLDLPGLQFSSSDEVLIQRSDAGENYVRILYALARISSSDTNTILEIGLGESSRVFANALGLVGKLQPHLCSVEINSVNITPPVRTVIESFGVGWTVVIGDSLKVPLDQLPPMVDLLYIDGDHGGEHAIGDYRKFSPLVRAGGLIVYDDYPIFPGPAAAVATLTAEGVVGSKLTYNTGDGNSFYVIRK